MLILEKKITARFFTFEELSHEDRALLYRAYSVRQRAQAPYSGYQVGAALRTAGGEYYSGCNVERCSYTQTTHAEQNAIDTMVAAEGPAKIAVIAIVAGPADRQVRYPPVAAPDAALCFSSPCGHCLQCIWENCHGDPTVRILDLRPNGLVLVTTIGDALPMPFGPTDLGIDYGKK